MFRITSCPACTSHSAAPVATADSDALRRYRVFSELKFGGLLNDWIREIELVILGCTVCGHSWYRDQPDSFQLREMYERGIPLRNSAKSPNIKFDAYIAKEIRRLKKLVHSSEPSLLDYGAGFGSWSKTAVELGFVVDALEPSKARGNNIEKSFNVILDFQDVCGRVFDVVNLEQVLEHLADPYEVLKQIRKVCHERSIVRITVPNLLRSIEGSDIWKEWPFNGSRVHTMAPFEHLHGFTPRSLRNLVYRSGFEPVDLSSMLRVYPNVLARRSLGYFFPRLDKTFLIVQPKA